jgi:hypothetical protein
LRCGFAIAQARRFEYFANRVFDSSAKSAELK